MTLKNVFSLLFCLRLLLGTILDRKKIIFFLDHLEPRFLLLLPPKSYYVSSRKKNNPQTMNYITFSLGAF